MAADFIGAALAFISRAANSLVVASIILLLGFIAGRLLGKLVERVLEDLEVNKAVQSAVRLSLPLDEIFGAVVMYSIYFFAIVLAVDALDLELVFFNAIALVIIALIMISILFSLIDFVPNVFSGIYLHQKGNARPGDNVKVGDIEGKVESIDLVDTRVETKNGDKLYVPNNLFVKQAVIVRKNK